MSCNRKISSFVAAREARSKSYYGLFVLLPYLLLPLIYYNHLTGKQDFSLYLRAGPESQAPIILGQGEKPLHPLHQSTCPICQGASSFQDYGIFAVVQAPDHPSLILRHLFSNHPSQIANFHLIVSGPRAPPVALYTPLSHYG